MTMAKASLAENLTIGDAAHRAYACIILANANVRAFELCRYVGPPPFQERVRLGDFEQAILAASLEKRRSHQMPFWQAVFASVLEKGQCSPALVDAAVFHNGPGESEVMPVEVLDGVGFDGLIDGVDTNISLSSRLHMFSGEDLHLGFMDFRCAASPSNLEIVKTICGELYERRYVLCESGNSYHACGLRLMSNSERLELLGKSLLLSPVTDVAYSAHQIRQGHSTIRISRGGSTNSIPRVISFEL